MLSLNLWLFSELIGHTFKYSLNALPSVSGFSCFFEYAKLQVNDVGLGRNTVQSLKAKQRSFDLYIKTK
jgi:hypothetical protein